ncbi:NADPH-dependent FMN reductase [Paraflavitalea pollutisoli]|uniref:NADPH-dependent FMN reductase n=1 Tax=Paraflavitalea pollutisoli TaxID=3034143 RepID=UPI0023EAF4AF|nr:NAD(P)H-dependent oxidoreductase [Paraflavitalea sp. H1-2-19X]
MNIQLVGLSGSLRKGSYNTALLQAAAAMLPPDVSLTIAAIDDLPLYNADLDKPAVADRPATVVRLREQLAAAHGILIASPEYNYGIPGGLKNAIDWASRGEDAPLRHKPVALMGATISLWGTVRMQLSFLPVFQYLSMKPHYQPEVLVNEAVKKFDKGGNLTDVATREIIAKKLQSFRQFILDGLA